jgi:hypothetical protein
LLWHLQIFVPKCYTWLAHGICNSGCWFSRVVLRLVVPIKIFGLTLRFLVNMHRSRKKRTYGELAVRRSKVLDLGLNLSLILSPPTSTLGPTSSSSSTADSLMQIDAPPLSPPAYFVYLPPELITRILCAVELSRRDLVNLALVSHQMNEFVTPLIYENVQVHASVLPTDASGAFLVNADAQPAIPAHCLRIVRDPALGEHVRTLHVSEIHKRHRPLVTCLPVMVDNMPHLRSFHWDIISGMDIESSNLILDAVRDCRELRSLRLGAKIGVNFTDTDNHIQVRLASTTCLLAFLIMQHAQISGFQRLHDFSFRVLNSIHDDSMFFFPIS